MLFPVVLRLYFIPVYSTAVPKCIPVFWRHHEWHDVLMVPEGFFFPGVLCSLGFFFFFLTNTSSEEEIFSCHLLFDWPNVPRPEPGTPPQVFWTHLPLWTCCIGGMKSFFSTCCRVFIYKVVFTVSLHAFWLDWLHFPSIERVCLVCISVWVVSHFCGRSVISHVVLSGHCARLLMLFRLSGDSVLCCKSSCPPFC